jgi:tetratricopeptide (TPR) repeat protein
MKQFTSFLTMMTLAFTMNAQNYHQAFQDALQNGNEDQQWDVLQEWKKKAPNDAELYTSLFNYYFYQSKDEIVILSKGTPPKDEKILILSDSTNQVAGYIGSQINYEESNLKKAFAAINKGIELYPNRLDMRFGKIHVLGQIKDWNNFTNEIIKTVNHSSINHNQWTWTYNEKQDGGQDFFLSCLQDYQMQLYNTMDDKLLINMQKISKSVLAHYPNHIESLSNLSIAYLVSKQYDKALVPLLKAEKLNPKDYIVLNNIAYAYKESGDTKNAISYYNKVIQYGDAPAKAQAEQELSKLKTTL